MTREEAIKLSKEPFVESLFQHYRLAHSILFERYPTNCSCSMSALYRKLNEYAKSETK